MIREGNNLGGKSHVSEWAPPAHDVAHVLVRAEFRIISFSNLPTSSQHTKTASHFGLSSHSPSLFSLSLEREGRRKKQREREREMGTVNRLTRNEMWKKGVFHFLLCFVVGFFVGFVTSGGKPSSDQIADRRTVIAGGWGALDEFHAVEEELRQRRVNATAPAKPFPVSSEEKPASSEPIPALEEEAMPPRRLLIVVTTTKAKDPFQDLFLRRLANTLRLVPPPLLWIVVESHSEAAQTARTLRRTGVMYRHLVFGETFPDPEAEIHHQRNLALNHIEDHRLSGIVHFSALSDAYDLQFFDEIREIEYASAFPSISKITIRKSLYSFAFLRLTPEYRSNCHCPRLCTRT